MKEQNQQQAKQAFEAKDFQTAANIWINGCCLPEESLKIKNIYRQSQQHLTSGVEDVYLYALLQFIYLDYSHYFTEDREDALMQVISWGKKGLELDSENYHCCRHLASALYWLGDEKNAKIYYQKAIKLKDSPTLQVRLFSIENTENEHPDFQKIKLNWDGTDAMEYYNAGVELNYIINDFENISEADIMYLKNLKLLSYQKAYHLYEDTLIKKTGNPFNADGHTFAMCCNNLATEYNNREEYQKSLDCINTGMQFSYFLYLLQNRLTAFDGLKRPKETYDDALQMLKDFDDEISFGWYFSCVVCICDYLNKRAPEETIKWVNDALESYNALDNDAPEKMDATIIANYGRLLALKSNAQQKLGIVQEAQQDSDTTDDALMENPDNPLLIINRAIIFGNEGNYEKEIECYDIAIKYATEQNNKHLLKTAFYNKGYTLIAQYQNHQQALQLFEQINTMELGDFWTFYWFAHCCYSLQNNSKCVEYADKAFEKLPNQPNVTTDIIAQLYEYKGTSLLDLKQYEKALESYQMSLQYQDNELVRGNIKIAEDELKNSDNFIKKFFKGW